MSFMAASGGERYDFAVFVVCEVDGVGGAGDVESAQEAGDVEGVFVAFGGDFHGQERFGVCGLKGESVELFDVAQVASRGQRLRRSC